MPAGVGAERTSPHPWRRVETGWFRMGSVRTRLPGEAASDTGIFLLVITNLYEGDMDEALNEKCAEVSYAVA